MPTSKIGNQNISQIHLIIFYMKTSRHKKVNPRYGSIFCFHSANTVRPVHSFSSEQHWLKTDDKEAVWAVAENKGRDVVKRHQWLSSVFLQFFEGHFTAKVLNPSRTERQINTLLSTPGPRCYNRQKFVKNS